MAFTGSNGFASASATPVWDVRILPSSQGPPPSVLGMQQIPQASTSNLNEELANKVAEIDVLRKRLQQFDRENSKMKSELAVAKDQGAHQEKTRQIQGDVERLNNELRWAKQDLMSSEAERKRLHSACQVIQAELQVVKSGRQLTDPGPSPMQTSAVQALPGPAPQTGPALQMQAGAVQPMQVLPAPGLPAPMAHPVPAPAVQPMQVAAPPMVQTGGSVASTTGSSFAAVSASPSLAATQSKPAASAAGNPLQAPGLANSGPPLTESRQWRQDVLLRELACWEAAWKSSACSAQQASATTPPSSWFTLREAVGRLTQERASGSRSSGVVGATSGVTAATADAVVAIAARIRIAGDLRQWAAVTGGARFAQVWVGLFPDAVAELNATAAEAGSSALVMELFTGLIDVLHAVVLDGAGQGDALVTDRPDEAKERHACTAQLLKFLLEVVSKLQPVELHILSNILERPSLSALLAESPHPGSLHLSCMRLLQALVASEELFARAHQAECDKNPLLAAANLLIIPAIDPEGKRGPDSSDLQRCRVAALELFCRCLATAPRPDIVLQLREAPTVNAEHVDTVLQRVVFLCHHELLCLGLHGQDGGTLRDLSMRECARIRQRAVELSLMILSSFVWHAAPWTPDAKGSDHKAACAAACTALGRMRPLLASIVDMVARRAQSSTLYARLLGSISAVRILLEGIDGECDGCLQSGDDSVANDHGGALVPMTVG